MYELCVKKVHVEESRVREKSGKKAVCERGACGGVAGKDENI